MSDQPDTIPPPVTPAWAKTELARHPQRPYPMDFIERIFTDFTEIHGDRFFGDDPAMACGMARFEGQEVMVIANLKGRSTKEKVHRRFGMPNPEGYRKALRCMKLAEKFSRPVIAIIDVPAAYPGVGAEERGQAEAIARNLREMSRLRVPTIAAITGEGGSGGALGLALADRVLILEDAIYSVIPPEGCAAILWMQLTKARLPRRCASPLPMSMLSVASTTLSRSPRAARIPIPPERRSFWQKNSAGI
jgi:acetyl-CoA carboxylase carboxyl transferase subunit alpha